jgi:hypothetical protein
MADNVTVTCEPNIYKMCDPRHLKTYHRGGVTFLLYVLRSDVAAFVPRHLAYCQRKVARMRLQPSSVRTPACTSVRTDLPFMGTAEAVWLG